MKNKKQENKIIEVLRKTWRFIWHDDSVLSWIVNVILAFLIVKFLFYPGLSLAVGTDLPLVAVTSSSMEHRPGTDNNVLRMCGEPVSQTGKHNLEEWWDICGRWYKDNTNITLEDFEDYPLRNGFNKGDIIFLRNPDDASIGDIIVFHSGKQYPIIHRVIEKHDDYFETKGDNNPGLITDSQLNEEEIRKETVIGKAYGRIPYLGYIKIWFTKLINLF